MLDNEVDRNACNSLMSRESSSIEAPKTIDTQPNGGGQRKEIKMKQTESTHHRRAQPTAHTTKAMRAKMVKRQCVTFDLRAERINCIGQRHFGIAVHGIRTERHSAHRSTASEKTDKIEYQENSLQLYLCWAREEKSTKWLANGHIFGVKLSPLASPAHIPFHATFLFSCLSASPSSSFRAAARGPFSSPPPAASRDGKSENLRALSTQSTYEAKIT